MSVVGCLAIQLGVLAWGWVGLGWVESCRLPMGLVVVNRWVNGLVAALASVDGLVWVSVGVLVTQIGSWDGPWGVRRGGWLWMSVIWGRLWADLVMGRVFTRELLVSLGLPAQAGYLFGWSFGWYRCRLLAFGAGRSLGWSGLVGWRQGRPPQALLSGSWWRKWCQQDSCEKSAVGGSLLFYAARGGGGQRFSVEGSKKRIGTIVYKILRQTWWG